MKTSWITSRRFESISSPIFRCVRSTALEVEAIAKEITNLKPVAVIVDLMLFSSSHAAKAAAMALWRSVALLESHARGEAGPAQSSVDDDEIETPIMASDWLRALKAKCPGVPLIVFSQLEATMASLANLVSAAIAKRLDTKARLINSKDFAEKVRLLVNR